MGSRYELGEIAREAFGTMGQSFQFTGHGMRQFHLTTTTTIIYYNMAHTDGSISNFKFIIKSIVFKDY